MRKQKKIITFVIGCMTLLLVGSTYSYWHGEIEHTNQLQADWMNAEIIEDFTQKTSPSGTVIKKVSFQNNSSSSAFLRVAYAETWEKHEENDTLLLNNQQSGQDVAKKNWTEDWKNRDLWQDGGDGWFYYKKVLSPGGETETILESVTFPEYEGVYQEYKDADYQLYFRMELLQVSDSQSTLNSEEVNTKASNTVFGKEAVVSGENVSWK